MNEIVKIAVDGKALSYLKSIGKGVQTYFKGLPDRARTLQHLLPVNTPSTTLGASLADDIFNLIKVDTPAFTVMAKRMGQNPDVLHALLATATPEVRANLLSKALGHTPTLSEATLAWLADHPRIAAALGIYGAYKIL